VEKSGALADYESYLGAYPNGQYAEVAKRRINKIKADEETKRKEAERQTWESAQKTNTIAGYKDYKRRYPNGEFVALAERRLGVLRETEKTKARETELAKQRNPVKGMTLNRPLGNGVEMEFVGIPSGSFMMGSTENESNEVLKNCGKCLREWLTNEMPKHKVTFANGF
jgi:hypothetical protein